MYVYVAHVTGGNSEDHGWESVAVDWFDRACKVAHEGTACFEGKRMQAIVHNQTSYSIMEMEVAIAVQV